METSVPSLTSCDLGTRQALSADIREKSENLEKELEAFFRNEIFFCCHSAHSKLTGGRRAQEKLEGVRIYLSFPKIQAVRGSSY
jgi:thermostable 8-oxoguanine DNA glycosylase